MAKKKSKKEVAWHRHYSSEEEREELTKESHYPTEEPEPTNDDPADAPEDDGGDSDG